MSVPKHSLETRWNLNRLSTIEQVMNYSSGDTVNSLFNEPVPDIITNTGGVDFYNRWLYEHHGFTTVYEPLEIIRSTIDNVLTANAYKYEHLYNTIIADYSLADPIERRTTEEHSGTDTTTEDNGLTVTPSGQEKTTHATDANNPNSVTSYSTTYDSTVEKETGRKDTRYNTHDTLEFINRETTSSEDKEKTLEHGHTITTTYQYYREPQSEIQSERQIAMFSLQMTIIGDILDAIAIPVYMDYNKTVQPY